MEWGDLLAKYVAVNISSPHERGKVSVLHKASSDLGQCLSISLGYSVLLWRVGRGILDVDPRSDAQGPELLSSIFATFVASKILDPES